MKKLSLILVIVLLASTALIAFENQERGMRSHNMGEIREQMVNHHKSGMHAGRRYNNHAHKGGDMLIMVAEELEISDAVKDEIMIIRKDNRKVNIQIRAEIDILKIDKQEAMKNHDFKTVKKINGTISNKNLKMRNNRVDLHDKLWNKLTKEQQTKAEELMKKHHLEGRKRNLPRFRN